MRLDDGQIEVVDDMVAEILKKKTPAQRLKLAFDTWHSARLLLFYHIKFLHADWDENMIRKEVARRLSHGAV
ncbi:MAG: hypothetical protein HZC45_03820 [Deltaproteobacteria bacterium]|nr:hypothetical protein [Deltaproteobacteria bacterium]